MKWDWIGMCLFLVTQRNQLTLLPSDGLLAPDTGWDNTDILTPEAMLWHIFDGDVL